MSDLIDAYLDESLSRLHGSAASIRRTLVEAEAHLREAADTEEVSGYPTTEAQCRAIERFGSARAVAAAMNRATTGVTVSGLLGALAGQAARMVAVALGAVGVAALAAQALALYTSTAFVFGTPAGAAPPSDRCGHWLAVQPSATTCAQAAALENADDTALFYVGGAVTALVLIGLLFGVAIFLRRLRAGAPAKIRITGVISGIGTAVFGCAGAVLLFAAVTNISLSGLWGQGLWFVEGSVAIGVALCYAVALMRSLVRGELATH